MFCVCDFQRSGAVGACRAHNPEVVGSKPTFATGKAVPSFLCRSFFFVWQTEMMAVTIANLQHFLLRPEEVLWSHRIFCPYTRSKLLLPLNGRCSQTATERASSRAKRALAQGITHRTLLASSPLLFLPFFSPPPSPLPSLSDQEALSSRRRRLLHSVVQSFFFSSSLLLPFQL